MMDLYNRGGFSEGYGRSYHGKQMMSLSRPNHSGVYVGDVTSVKGSQVMITLKESVNAQDILEIRSGEEEAGYEFTLKDGKQKGETLTTNVGRPPAERDKGKADLRAVHKGAAVYRTKNNELLSRITETYLNQDRKRGITGHLTARLGEELTLTLCDRKISVTVSQQTVQEAKNQPMTSEKLAEPLKKLGDTLFCLDELKIDAGENIFVPVAWLNELRRAAVGKLQTAILDYYRRSKGTIPETASSEEGDGTENRAIQAKTDELSSSPRSTDTVVPYLCVSVRTMAQFLETLKFFEVTSIYGDYDGFEAEELSEMAKACEAAGKGFYLMLPHICRQNIFERLSVSLKKLGDSPGISGYIVKNLEEIALLQSLMKEGPEAKEIILNHNVYVFNQEAKEFYREKGINHYTAPLELNARELSTLGINDCDIVVYGYLPLMVSVQCLHESTEGCLRCKAGELRKDYLIDRMGKKFYVQTNCNGCYNVILNGQCLSLLRYAGEVMALKPRGLRLDFTMETTQETGEVIRAFISGYHKGRHTELSAENLTAGHFKRGVE